ncbi:glycosyltransferase family A protein [Gryllotalpicola sp.]|uniref:glycosyltransferase family A protein n=1 Tax=Gryllotalpicola sp. TaxID=1932787 RepID=UPI002601FE98|nr:glycosyltransferase family A protein [Gryllotalpicola sp.]
MASVGIVVRTRDRALFLERALRDIADQTYADWRVFLVNDGGDPAAVRAVVDRAGLGERATVVDHATSSGRWPSANAGVRAALAAGSSYLVLHDDDDTWAPGFLETAVAYLGAHPLAPGVVSRIEIVWEERRGDGYHETGREEFQPQLPAPLLSDTLLFNRFVPIGFLYRRELHDEIGFYDESLSVVGDWEFNLRILSRWALEYLGPEPLAFWHQRRSASGIDANSVIGDRADHERYDALVRDAALRSYVAEHGAGLALYLAKLVDQRFFLLDRRVLEVEGRLRGGLAAAAVRWLRAGGPLRGRRSAG